MPASNSKTFQERRARLRQSYLDQLPARIGQAQDLLARLTPGADARPALRDLHLLFHTIKGSGASFGFAAIARAAGRAEDLLRETLDGEAAASERLVRDLTDWLRDLEALRVEASEHAPPDSPPGFVMPAAADKNAPDRDRRLIYLCDDDGELGQQLAGQLACFGYQVLPFVSLEDLRQNVLSRPPAVIVMDVMFPEGEHAGPELLARLNQELPRPIPSIFISSRDDFASRLHGVQAGGSAYCTKPIKTTEIVEFLDLLTNRTAPEPFNILVVDDDPDIAQFHAMALEAAGMVTRTVNEPEQVTRVLDTFKADLVLMDLYMPRCSGPELAGVLRQIPGHVSLPIIYVSSETDTCRQFKALRVGADGFLTKPIAPDRLVAEVQLRAERMRTLRALMVRDSLTGLFNHNTILQFLEVAVATARRNGTQLCFAMIDVDRFKQVNDTHGHAAGDQVLMALARTLRLRLRDSDLVGRYGGEEFAVVLGGIDVQAARGLLDAMRESFAAVSFFANGQEFHCTFSGGLAVFPDCPDTRTLKDVADRALYRAKRDGRNRVEPPQPEDLAAAAEDPAAACRTQPPIQGDFR